MSYIKQCQNDLLSFWKLLVPDFVDSCHHTTLATELQLLLTDSSATNLSISCPPRIGKSSNTIRALAWAAGNSEGGLNHICASYGLTLSGKHKTLWNNTVSSEEFAAVFGKHKAKQLISPLFTSLKATGTGVAAGSELLTDNFRGAFLYDDMVKELLREPLPESVLNWYTSVASTRKQKRNASINIGTRFGLQDFSQMLRVTEGTYCPHENPTGYRFINLPALLENSMSFCEELHPTAKLIKMRDNPATSEVFWILYQGQPEKVVGLEEPISPLDYQPHQHGDVVDTFCVIDTSKGMDNPTAVVVFSLTTEGFFLLQNFWELWGLQSVSTLKTALAKLDIPARGLVESVGFGTALPYTQIISNKAKRERLLIANDGLSKMVKRSGLDVTRLVDQINNFGTVPLDDLADCCAYAIGWYHKLPPLPHKSQAPEHRLGSFTNFRNSRTSLYDQLAAARR